MMLMKKPNFLGFVLFNYFLIFISFLIGCNNP